MITALKRLLTTSLLGAALLSASTVSVAAEKSAIDGILASGELRGCFEAGYLPFYMKAKNGQFIGFDIDVAKHMANSMGVKFVPVNTAWDGIIPALQTGKCDIIIGGMGITPERNLQVLFADTYLEIGQTVLIRPDLAKTVKSYQDLNDAKYTVASQIGTTGAMAAQKYLPKAKLNLFETSADGVLQVANGQADAFVYDLPYNALYASQHKDKVVHLSKSFTYEPLGWAIRRGDADFINFLNNYLKMIKNDGTYDRLYAKWFESDAWVNQVQ
ncbi:transporter substrate-binding domain-containing protein [Parathalassolituus penaei]|uniref:Transporter substrate-binding domain-containing protein n=1 Tax=Parathalassolituus penaei TaxID=2997323 RepID=A0A9X3ED96_9GAMM|nr:transporter substrate-binding domain-containing protein [Parathalassolituus penaei]MCY0965478.1 transporter substrate-binding domain-containing protein [Parathalassolituus penaei]